MAVWAKDGPRWPFGCGKAGVASWTGMARVAFRMRLGRGGLESSAGKAVFCGSGGARRSFKMAAERGS